MGSYQYRIFLSATLFSPCVSTGTAAGIIFLSDNVYPDAAPPAKTAKIRKIFLSDMMLSSLPTLLPAGAVEQ
jgi:hypothetical protein